jgi:hypothetical protein
VAGDERIPGPHPRDLALHDHVGRAADGSLDAPTPMPMSPRVGPTASHRRAHAFQAAVVNDCTGTRAAIQHEYKQPVYFLVEVARWTELKSSIDYST